MEIITPWELYLWTRLDALNAFFNLLSCASGFLLAVCMIGGPVNAWMGCDWADKFGESDTDVLKYFKTATRMRIVFTRTLGVFLVATFLLLATPSSKNAAMIYVIPKIMNNEHIQQEASEIYTIAKEAMKEYLPKSDD